MFQGPDLPETIDDAEMVQVSNDEIILVGGELVPGGFFPSPTEPPTTNSRKILSFTLGEGWRLIGQINYPVQEHGAVLVPAGSVKCAGMDFE